MYTKLSASRAYVYAVARACDRGHISRRVSPLALSLEEETVSSYLVEGLCRGDSVLDRQGHRGGPGWYAMSRREWLYQWSGLTQSPISKSEAQSMQIIQWDGY
jgi:hypothetical protein